MRSLLARHQHTSLAIFQILLQQFPIDFVHIRMVEELIEFHPLGGCDFAWTRGNRVGAGLVADRAQRHNDVEVGTIEIGIVRMPDVDEALEASANAGFFEDFTDDSLDEVFTCGIRMTKY